MINSIHKQICEIRTEGNLDFKTKYPSIYNIVTSENIDEQIIEKILLNISKLNITKKDAGKVFGEMLEVEYRYITDFIKLKI